MTLAGMAGLEAEFRDDFPARVIFFLSTCTVILFQIFLTMRLDGDIDWSWWVAWLC
jgi:hypothetical protein